MIHVSSLRRLLVRGTDDLGNGCALHGSEQQAAGTYIRRASCCRHERGHIYPANIFNIFFVRRRAHISGKPLYTSERQAAGVTNTAKFVRNWITARSKDLLSSDGLVFLESTDCQVEIPYSIIVGNDGAPYLM